MILRQDSNTIQGMLHQPAPTAIRPGVQDMNAGIVRAFSNLVADISTMLSNTLQSATFGPSRGIASDGEQVMAQPTTAYSIQWSESQPMRSLAPSELVRLERFYTLHERFSVLTFLGRFPSVAPVLFEASGHIRAVFPQPQITLEVVTDYDASKLDDSKCLVAYIATRLDPSEAVARLNDLYTSWWFDVSGDARKRLSFDLEFI